MPYQFIFDKLPAGIAARASKSGEPTVSVLPCELVTSQDGAILTDRLEGFADQVLSKNPTFVPQSQVDQLLVVIQRDRTATAYLNELPMLVTARTKRDVLAGAPIMKDDIADVAGLTFGDISIPRDAGVILILSVGWRKAFFFDFQPLHPSGKISRTYDFDVLAGQVYSELFFQELHRISESAWEILFENSWFPFRGLSSQLIDKMVCCAKEKWDFDELLPDIIKETKDRCLGMLPIIERNCHLRDHAPILATALSRYREKDYISCISILFTRIEGILRELLGIVSPGTAASQSQLAKAVTTATTSKSPLLPMKFAEYLRTVYFAHFSSNTIDINVTRHSVAHGVAAPDSFSEKTATIGVLILQQLLYYLPPTSTSGSEDSQAA